MHHGSCLCGSIQYQINSDLKAVVNCHCQFCRRAHGAPFVPLLFTAFTNITIVQGEELLARYTVKKVNADRCFCSRCGTRLYNHLPAMNMASVVVASFDTDEGIHPVAHVNIESKCSWYQINDNLPQFQTVPAPQEFSRLLAG